MHFTKLNYCQMQFVEGTPNICPSAYTVYGKHDIQQMNTKIVLANDKIYFFYTQL